MSIRTTLATSANPWPFVQNTNPEGLVVMPEFELDTFLPYQLAILADRMSRQFSALYNQKFGISVSEWRVVAHLSQEEAVSVREIHRKVDMDKSKVSRAAARLERAGYITKKTNPGDKRLVELSLTEKGQAMMAKITPMARAYEQEVLRILGPHATCFRDALEHLLRQE